MFFEKFREAAARLPAGLVRPGTAGDVHAIAAAERALGRRLPEDYASFLRSFDGADLFHESVVIAGVGERSPLSLLAVNAGLAAPEVTFAETSAGDRFVFAPVAGAAADVEAVFRVRGGSDERVRAGTTFSSWLDATIAREQILYGPDGEFAPEVFDPDGEEIVPRIALRQSERALRADPGSAEAHQDRGVALRRLDRLSEAGDAFERAALIDPLDPWLWFDLGRTVLADDPRRALAAFRRAADADADGGPAGARMLAWAAHAALAAGDDAAAAEARTAALARQPALADELGRAVAAAVEEGDTEAARQAAVLVEAIEPARRRLPMLGDAVPAAAKPVKPRAPRAAGPEQAAEKAGVKRHDAKAAMKKIKKP